MNGDLDQEMWLIYGGGRRVASTKRRCAGSLRIEPPSRHERGRTPCHENHVYRRGRRDRRARTLGILGVLRVLCGSFSEQITEATGKTPMFCLGAPGVLGGERQPETVRLPSWLPRRPRSRGIIAV